MGDPPKVVSKLLGISLVSALLLSSGTPYTGALPKGKGRTICHRCRGEGTVGPGKTCPRCQGEGRR